MSAEELAPIISAMTPPFSARKFVLVPTGGSAGSSGQPAVRRYRMARLRLETPEGEPGKPYEYLKRSFD
jgi:hypothetical protein